MRLNSPDYIAELPVVAIRTAAIAPRPLAAAIVAVIGLGLVVDIRFALPGQVAVSLVVWGFFLWLLARTDLAGRRALLACLAYSTAGELFLSLVWGLYEYQFANVPLFVPPGHALLFTLGTLIAPRLTPRMVAAVPLLVAPYAIAAALAGTDTLGAALFLLFLLCLRTRQARALYATMFVLSLAMEIYGTALGNWRWLPDDPWFGLTSTNPPVSAGAFYCVLDFLIVATVTALDRARPAAVPAAPAAR